MECVKDPFKILNDLLSETLIQNMEKPINGGMNFKTL